MDFSAWLDTASTVAALGPVMSPTSDQFGRSLDGVRKTGLDGGSEQHSPHDNSAFSAALASAMNGKTAPLSMMPPGSMQCTARSAPIMGGVPQHHSCSDNFKDQRTSLESTAGQYDPTPAATWSAWINEERRRSDVVDPCAFPPYGGPHHASSLSHKMPPQFFEPKASDFDELASRLPHGLLGGMLDCDSSDTASHAASRSTSSRRARLGTEGSAPTTPGMDLFRHEESQNLSRLKAVLSQCAPNTEAIAASLAHSGLPCTLPGLTKLISKFNKSDQWRRGLAVFHALPAVGLSADATVANAALGSCDRGAAADSAWSIFYLMCERNLEADAISYKALISALCKGGQWQRGVVAFARAVEAGVPIEAATVMVLLFALARAQQPQPAEAVFCTAFGMFADMQPLLSAPWPSDSPTCAQNLAGDPSPRKEFSSGLRSPNGSGSARPEDQSVQNLFSYPGATDGPDADQCCMEAQVAALGLGEGPALSVPPSIAITSVPASCADSSCPSAAAKTSADPPAEDSPQALLARVLDLYQLLMENHANAKRAGASVGSNQQFALGRRVPDSNTFLPTGIEDLTTSLDGSLAGGVRDSEHPMLLAALVGWQREHSVLSQSCANPRASGSSGSLASCSISRSNSITSLGTAPSVSARTPTATATISGSPHSSRADCGTRGHTDGGRYSHQTMSGNIFGAGRGGYVPETPNTVAPTAASLGFISTDPLCAACCNAMLSAYCSAPVPEADRAARLLRLLHSAGGSLEPDVVAYNTVMQAQAARGNLEGMLETLTALSASGLRPTTTTFSTLMHAHTMAGATPVVLELWYQMLQARVLPSTVCLRAYTLSAFRCGDTGHTQDARSRYFGHLLTLPPKQAAAEACTFLQMHGELGPPGGQGGRWPAGLSPAELCATLTRRNGHQSQVALPEPAHAHGARLQNPSHEALMHAQAHHVQLPASQQQMPEPPMQMMTHAEGLRLQAEAHAQGYAQAQAHARQIVQQAASLGPSEMRRR